MEQSGTVVLITGTTEASSKSPEACKNRFLDPFPRVADSGGLEWDWECVSNKFPAAAAADDGEFHAEDPVSSSQTQLQPLAVALVISGVHLSNGTCCGPYPSTPFTT